jgi:hypothetical protein
VIRVELKQTAQPAIDAPAAITGPLDSLVVCKDTQRLIFENQYVRVLEERVPPGIAQPMHSHRKGILIPLADSEVESQDQGSPTSVRRKLTFGVAGWRDVTVHSVRNAGSTELRNIRIELK